LTTASSTPNVVQRRGRPLRLALADRGLALVEVADRHGDVRQRPLHLLAGLSRDGQNIGR
jgi:hypothetical protein